MEVDVGMAEEGEQGRQQGEAVSATPSSVAPSPGGGGQAQTQTQSGGQAAGVPPPPQQQQHHHQPQQQVAVTVAGPRAAPAYKAISAICEKRDDGPGPRCGHTLTAVAAVGEEGTAGYVGPRLILFGGATALEGNSGAAGPQTASSGAGIRMFYVFLYFIVMLLS